ncbi:MAG: four helix bundle protein [Thermodesulfobacteriota bacterium]
MENRNKTLKHFRDLEVYKLAFESAMNIFEITKRFPSEEKYSLVDQIRRSSRSVCSNLAEAWRKRKYEAVFKNKLTDAMQEASETQTWLDFCFACNYIDKKLFDELDSGYEKILGMLNAMERKADTFCFTTS